jgi:hypothetical protein
VILLLNYATVALLFFTVVLSWGLIERRFRLNGDKVDPRFRIAWGLFSALSIYIIAWPIPPSEPYLIIRAAIGRTLLTSAVVFIGHMIWTYDKGKDLS